MKFTVLGANGFIGSNIVKYLKEQEIECHTPEIRKEDISNHSLGHVIYAIGLTSDFRTRPFDTVNAHVCTLQKILQEINFDSFLYLSSTRVYAGSNSACEEDNLTVNPLSINEIYNISKIMGESLCLASEKSNIRIARLSNVIGDEYLSGSFLDSVLRDILEKQKVVLRTTLDSEKDYISINDVIEILPEITMRGKEKIYNVANGKNTKVNEILKAISRVTKFDIEVSNDANYTTFPKISIGRIRKEFLFNPTPISEIIEDLTNCYKKKH